MSLRQVREALDAWSRAGERSAVATLVEVRRSAPQPPGARFAISAAGDIAGSISSGCVEGDLHARLLGVLDGAPASIVSYGITDEMAAGVGLSCGGEIEVLLAPHDPADLAWIGLEDTDDGEPFVLVTGLSEGIMGRSMSFRPDPRGTLGDDRLDAPAAEAAGRALGTTGSGRAHLVEGDPSSEVFVESFAPPPRLVIVGATPIAEALCVFASKCGFDVYVVDPRGSFARPDRFPDARGLIERWPDEALEALRVDRHTRVVVLTHDAKLDVPALGSALAAGCSFVGLLGGRRTQAARREALREAGHPSGAIGAIRGPVGLGIGASTPSEIAVSILAELIAHERAP